MKKIIIPKSIVQTKNNGFTAPEAPVWRAVFEKDLAGRLKDNGSDPQKVGPSNMTMTIARMTQYYAEARDYNEVLALASALARDPGMPHMFSGEPAQQVVAHGLMGIAHKVAKDSKCSPGVQKSILTKVLGLCYIGGQREALIELVKKPSTPKEMAFASVAMFMQHKDKEALMQVQSVGHDAVLAEMAHKCAINLESRRGR